MSKKFEPARIRVRVPPRKWKSRAEVEAWAREQLAGGPPKLIAVVPKGHQKAGERATWKHIQDRAFDGLVVVLESDPAGLIVFDSETGQRKFVPSASRSGLVLGKTKPEEFIGSIDSERELRTFIKEENSVFNKVEQRRAESESRNWTFEWHQHGQRVRRFVQEHPEVSTERIWQELVKWGRGENGYSRQTHQDSTYFYDWLREASEDHQVFQLSTTRVQHILWADRSPQGRDRLLETIVSGPLGGLSDDEFAWLVGKRKLNWPLEAGMLNEFVRLGDRIKAGLPLSEAERARLESVLAGLRSRSRHSGALDKGNAGAEASKAASRD